MINSSTTQNQLKLSDLKVIYSRATLESTRWRRPIKTFWEKSIQSYLEMSKLDRSIAKKYLKIK